MDRPRLLLIPEFTELTWAIKPQLSEWADVVSYDPPGVGAEPLPEGDIASMSRHVVVERGLEKLEGDAALFWADADSEPLRILDTFPMPLCACYRIRQSSLPIRSATFGYNDAKRQFYYGLHPGCLITASGFIWAA